MLTREQAIGHGFSRHAIERMVNTGTWQSVANGLYSTVPTSSDWEAMAWGGVLLGGDKARLGPNSSGHLHGLIPQPPELVDVLIQADRRARTQGPWHFIRERPGARSARTLGPLAHLSIEDTVLDLCASASEGEIVRLLTRAVNRRGTTARAVLRQLEHRPRHPHRKLLVGILGEVSEGAESALELQYLRRVERAHGLPHGNRQRSRLGLAYLSDVGYDAYQTLVELDGRDGHEGEGRFRDMDRDNQFALNWLITLRYGWFDVVDRPCAVAHEVAQALRAHGWSGLPTRCPNCLNVPDFVLFGSARSI